MTETAHVKPMLMYALTIPELLGHTVTPELLEALSQYQIFPKSARELIWAIGVDATSFLINAWGGQEFHVPAVIGGGNPRGALLYNQISGVVGEQAAKQLVRKFGGTYVIVPNLKEAKHALVQDLIRMEFDGMVTAGKVSFRKAVFALGVKYRLASKTVERILKNPFNQTINQK